MKGEMWFITAMTAALMSALLAIALLSRPRTRLYRWARRIFWSFSLLFLSGFLGGPGVNLLNWAAVALLGAPGYGAMALLAVF